MGSCALEADCHKLPASRVVPHGKLSDVQGDLHADYNEGHACGFCRISTYPCRREDLNHARRRLFPADRR